jgi:hypothetical protein
MEAPSLADPGSAPTPLDLYRAARGQIEHEDNLITQRLNWFLASQAFLFSSYAIVLNMPLELRAATVRYSTVLDVIPLVAIIVGVLIWVGVVGGLLAMRRLRLDMTVRCRALFDAGFPAIHGHDGTRWMGRAAPTLLPPMFVFAWCTLLISNNL